MGKAKQKAIRERFARKAARRADNRGPVIHDASRQKKSIPYSEYLYTKHWLIVRRIAIQRAGSCCSVCGSNFHLQVHHLTYDNLWHERANDLCVLCGTCHAMLHGQY